MAGVADKARFFLEKTVPQLREWERKEIFNQVRGPCPPNPAGTSIGLSNKRLFANRI